MKDDRMEMRKVFFEAWRKHKENLLLEPIEAQLIDIMLLHPEYHEWLNQSEDYQTADFKEHNPFLHLSLHLALREQLSTNRPEGITEIYAKLCKKFQDQHVAEHKMLACLEEILWEAQTSGKMPEEKVYLEKLRRT